MIDPHQLRIVRSDTGDEAIRNDIADQLRAYNNEHSPFHRELRATGTQPLELYVYNTDEALLGGVIAETYWGWLHVRKVWLDDRLRGQGIGRRLLLQAEEIAQERGCRSSFLDTYSFQARGFYETLGYRVIGQLDDYPPGATFFWLRKDFAQGAHAEL